MRLDGDIGGAKALLALFEGGATHARPVHAVTNRRLGLLGAAAAASHLA